MTLGDVAAEAGVSSSTVSRVLNGGKPVREELHERVRAAAARIGYVSHVAASAMRGRNGLIAILTDELGAEALAELAIAAGNAATEAGLTTTVSSAGPRPEQQLLALQVLRSLRPQAIVLAGGWISDPTIRPTLEHELDEYIDADGGHVVVMGPAVLPYPTVSFDDAGDGAVIGHHMADHGSGPALILAGPITNESFRIRAESMKAALEDRGDFEVTMAFTANESAAAEAEIITRFTDSPAGLILCVSDRLALGAYAALDGLGLRIPRDVAVSGMDDLPVAAVLTPGLTSLRHPLSEVGRLVVDLALGSPARSFRQALAGDLLPRGSSGAPR